jgi:hypothetical protein
MHRSRTLDRVEADLAALRASAERAGVALACLFASSDEYEAGAGAIACASPRSPARSRSRSSSPDVTTAAKQNGRPEERP